MTTFLVDADDVRNHNVRDLLREILAAPDRVLIHLSPTIRHGSEATLDVLRQTNMFTPGPGGSASGNLGLLTSALTARQVKAVVVAGAETLPTHVITELTSAILSTGADLWFLPTGPGSPNARKRIQSWADQTTDVASLRRSLMTATAPVETPTRPSLDLPDVPDVFWAVLPDRCDQELDSNYADAVDIALRRLVTTFQAAINANSADLLATALRRSAAESDHPSWPKLMSAALHIAAFIAERDLSIDEHVFRSRTRTIGKIAHLSPDEWNAVTRSLTPRHAAASALAASGLPADIVVGLLRSQVSDDGSTIQPSTGAPLTVASGARPVLIAQHLDIAIHGHGDFPFLSTDGDKKPNTRVVAIALTQASRASGIEFTTRWNSRRPDSSLGPEWGVNTASAAS